MTITNQHAFCYRGDSAVLAVTMTDANGDPFVLSPSGMIRYRISPSPHADEGDALVRKQLGAGLILIDGVVEISLTIADTTQDPGLYYHELKVYEGIDVSTAMVGNFLVRRALTMSPEVMTMAALSGQVSLRANAMPP
jgi:hypothetical protein